MISRSSRRISRVLRQMSSSSAEAERAAAASVYHGAAYNKSNIFAKILRGELPADVVHDDEKCMAFKDINPAAPTHVLVIPKTDISQLSMSHDNDAALLGHMMIVSRRIGRELEPNGFRIVINDGPAALQSVYHLHIHVLGGRQMQWPPG